MSIIDSFPDRVGHLFQRVNGTTKVHKVMIPLNLVDRVIKVAQVSHILLDLRKVLMFSIYTRVDWALKSSEIRNFGLNFTEFMIAVHIVHWPHQSFDIIQHPFHFSKLILMTNIINRATKIFDLDQILLDLVELMITIDTVYWIVESLKICQLPFYVLESMVSLLKTKHRSCQAFECVNFPLNLIEMMGRVNITPYWIMCLLESFQMTVDLVKVMVSIYFVHGVLKTLQARHMLLYLVKLMTVLLTVNGTL